MKSGLDAKPLFLLDDLLSFRNNNAPLESISPHCDNKYICQTYWRKKACGISIFFTPWAMSIRSHENTKSQTDAECNFFFQNPY